MSLSKPPVVTQKPYWPKVQAPATLDQTTVSQDAWYVLLNTTTNVEISAVKIWQTNAESAAGLLRAQSIKIEIQFGDVPGTGQALYGRCAYRKLEEATV